MKPGAPDHRVDVYDTTLRDGTQREGISLSCDDKLRIARRLDEIGVAFVEGGWPGSNPKDAAFFERARDLPWETAALTAFGSTRRAKIGAEDDANLRALLAAQTPVCTIFGKSSVFQVTEILRTALEENLRMIEESVAFLRSEGRRVVYDAEHFFDGYAEDRAYTLETLRAAVRGGAEILVLCDTNGGTMPWEIEAAVADVIAAVDHPVGIHTHDDGGCGVANALAAVRAGARQVQGTINGYGERCGNANLCAVLPGLELKLGARSLPEGGLLHLRELSAFVAEVANLAPDPHMAYVGRSAFAHKGGVHVSAIRRHPDAYHHIDPATVGNEMRVVVSELSGRSNLLSKAQEFGVDVTGGAEVAVLEDIKEAEARGFSFEAAEASVAVRLLRRSPGYQPAFELIDYTVIDGHREGDTLTSQATVKITVGDKVVHVAAEGNGPVSALDAAVRKALAPHIPGIGRIRLEDYKVRILDGRAGTDATTRVLMYSGDGDHRWSTVGASTNIVEASWQALVDSLEYGLSLAGEPEAASAGAPEVRRAHEAR